MRRERRNAIHNQDDLSVKIIKYAAIGVAILTVVVLGLLMYSKKLNDEVKQGSLNTEQIASLMKDNSEDKESEHVSTEMGKTVNEASNQTNTSNVTNETNTLNTTNVVGNTTTNSTKNTNTTEKKTQNGANQNAAVTSKPEKAKELSFQKPVEGDIVREFAKESLIYSETLQEWTTHMGIDIKAEKTAVVKCAEMGTVKTIKNDPRYGLTIVVEHESGFETVYANLLTSEFVVEGEKVEKGQSLGTVGNTAVFEIADESHLHFEMFKDSVQVDPSIYLK